jgi:hypothetical protein
LTVETLDERGEDTELEKEEYLELLELDTDEDDDEMES